MNTVDRPADDKYAQVVSRKLDRLFKMNEPLCCFMSGVKGSVGSHLIGFCYYRELYFLTEYKVKLNEQRNL